MTHKIVEKNLCIMIHYNKNDLENETSHNDFLLYRRLRDNCNSNRWSRFVGTLSEDY